MKKNNALPTSQLANMLTNWTQYVITGNPNPANLYAWYKADTLSLSNNDPVSTWPDSSGNGNDLTSSGGTRPTFKTGIQNSMPAVLFSGSQNMKNTTLSPVIGTPFSIFAVFNATSVSSSSVILCTWNSNTNQLRIEPTQWEYGGYSGAMLGGTASTGIHLFSVANFGTASSTFMIDGTTIATQDVGSGTTTQLGMGDNAGLGLSFSGYIMEIIITKHANVTEFNAWLRNKWNF